jgi:hypothetical protein
MAKFIILERAAREGKITIDHVASFLRTQLNDVNKKLGLNSSSITFNSKEMGIKLEKMFLMSFLEELKKKELPMLWVFF